MLSKHRGPGAIIVLVSCVLASCSLAACASTPSTLLRPNGVAVAADGSLYVMDRGHYRVVHLSPDGNFLGAFGKLGSQAEDIYYGWDIALDLVGNVYFCNKIYDEEGANMIHDGVKVFSPDGRYLRELGGQDYVYSNTDVQYNNMYGIDIDSQGRAYVADYGTNTLRVFDSQGQLLTTFFGETGSEDGQFNGLNDVAVDDQRNLIYVADNINSRVQQFSLALTDSGELTVTHLLSLGSYGREPGQFAYPQNIAVDDNSGRVYVGDMANHRIQVFDAEGHYVTEFSPPVKLWQVMGLNVGPDGAVYAADARNNAIWVFEPDGQLRAQIEVKQ
ncbi:MAG: NHL repeat-containing protein [Thermoflexales bacterium]|nr:NHL repeat-containing protein [Thermoflexales bacterium]